MSERIYLMTDGDNDYGSCRSVEGIIAGPADADMKALIEEFAKDRNYTDLRFKHPDMNEDLKFLARRPNLHGGQTGATQDDFMDWLVEHKGFRKIDYFEVNLD